jgi:hypothetical protein
MEAPRELPGTLLGEDKVRSYPDVDAVWRMPESLGLIQVSFVLWRCRDCDTYYQFHVMDRGWPRSGICQTYLWRLTLAAAMETYRRSLTWAKPRERPPIRQTLRRFEERLPEWMRAMQACLSHSGSAVRERAAQELASHFSARSELAGVTALLGNADASIRRGALLAFDFVSLELGPPDIVPSLLKSLMDPDASVARQAFVLLSRIDDEKYRKSILDQVSAIPTERRTPAVRMFLLAHSFEALVAGLADSEKEGRQEALSKALERSLGNFPFVEQLRTTLRAVPEASRTPEMNAYLSHANPDQWDDDD